MPRPYTEARKKNNKDWDAKNLDRISIAAPKGTKDAIKAAADAAGKSVNQFIIDALHPYLDQAAPAGQEE